MNFLTKTPSNKPLNKSDYEIVQNYIDGLISYLEVGRPSYIKESKWRNPFRNDGFSNKILEEIKKVNNWLKTKSNMTYDEWKSATPENGEPLFDKNYCDCGVILWHDEAFCDDCLCEMEDSQPKIKQPAIQSTVHPDLRFMSHNDWRKHIIQQNNCK